MRALEKLHDNVRTIEFSHEELGILNNALNEICNGIDIEEFETRIGASIDEVRKLLKEINGILK